MGATKVVFDVREINEFNWPPGHAYRRFWSICFPGPALAGLGVDVLVPGDTRDPDAFRLCRWGTKPIFDYWRSGKPFHRLKSPKPPADVKYTVTIRQTDVIPQRNSAPKELWLDFAKEIGAVVLEDFERKPIHLYDRMALYAGAEMNFFASNGPGVLCSFTEYPCMLFNTSHAAKELGRVGMHEPSKYPWMLENQTAIWGIATEESLRANFYHWKETGKFLNAA